MEGRAEEMVVMEGVVVVEVVVEMAAVEVAVEAVVEVVGKRMVGLEGVEEVVQVVQEQEAFGFPWAGQS